MSGHLLATVNPEAAAQADADGWKPAGPPLTEGSQWTPEELADFDRSKSEMNAVSPIGGQLGTRPSAIPTIGHIVIYHLRDGDSRNRRTKFPAIVMDAELETGLLKLWVIVDDGDTWMQDQVPARAAPERGWTLVEPMDFGRLDVIANLTARIAALEAKRPPGRPKGS